MLKRLAALSKKKKEISMQFDDEYFNESVKQRLSVAC